MTLPFSAIRSIAAGTLLCAFVAPAAAQNPSDAQSRYQQDRAACMSGASNQDRATCLREAGAARQEAQRGGLSSDPSQYERNRLARCDLQPASDRQDCIRRMNGEGVVTGSVEGGGIYRELTTVVPPR